MLKKKEIERRLLAIAHDSYLESYNDIFICGYKMALQEILEIRRPIAIPSQNRNIKNKRENETRTNEKRN